ncbi:MAG: FHA domain-containing protein [Acinetobacter sp.]
MSWTLQAISDELNGQEITIDHSMVVGRHLDCDIVLQSSAISRRHASFSLQQDGLWLSDLKSSNGTFVNDLRIENDTLLKQGDIVQFANIKFSVLAPATNADIANTDSENSHSSLAKNMNEQGMPSLTERVAETTLNREGVPQNISIPKPAPIPQNVDLNIKPEPQVIPVNAPPSRVDEEVEQQKNASVGLISIIVLILIALIAWFLFR